MKKSILGILLCCWSSLLLAQTPSEQLQQNLEQIKSLRANFSQTVSNHGRLMQRSSGTLIVKRPGGFRWESAKPIHQLIVANNQRLWIYDKDLAQVTIQRANRGIGSTPALFLTDSVNQLSKYFHVVAAPLGSGVVYTLTPTTKRNNYQYIQLRFEKTTLVAMRLLDHLGQTTDLRLSNVRMNAGVSAGEFNFHPPAGVDVIKQS